MMTEMEKVTTHTGKTILEHSIEWYKNDLLSRWTVEEIKECVLPQIFEWSNMYKAAVELTK